MADRMSRGREARTAAAELAAAVRERRFEEVEAALSSGFMVSHALDEAGWSPVAAVKSYQRWRRPIPGPLYDAYLRSRRKVRA
jgi:hypothetical protein